VDVRAAREDGLVDLDDRSQQDDVPLGPQPSDVAEQLHVHPLVDHAVEPEPRPPDRRLVGWLLVGGARGREVGRVDARWEEPDARVAVPLRLVEAAPADEDEIRALEELGLALGELRRRARERGQLVHAVVDDRAWREALRQRQRHRGVEPEHVFVEAVLTDELLEEPP
jgi:hypothetical protein